MEEKVKALYERYVDACAMCTTVDCLECEDCKLGMIIEDLAEILGIKK